MRFLLPIGGIVDHRFGILTAPNHKGIPVGITDGMDWGADLGCLDGPEYVKRFDPDAALSWLGKMWKYQKTCLFIAGRDAIGNARGTLDTFNWMQRRFMFWPLAFCAQDGQEDLEFPSGDWTTLFVGGTTEWKCSQAAIECIQRAQQLDKHIHIGRVNWHKRYQFFANLPGSENFTCDGTRTRFDGTDRTVKSWANYMEQDRRQLRLCL